VELQILLASPTEENHFKYDFSRLQDLNMFIRLFNSWTKKIRSEDFEGKEEFLLESMKGLTPELV
jgi:hypothetical protein